MQAPAGSDQGNHQGSISSFPSRITRWAIKYPVSRQIEGQAAMLAAAEPGLRDYWLQRSTHLLLANKLLV